jgi:hypothetical protein
MEQHLLTVEDQIQVVELCILLLNKIKNFNDYLLKLLLNIFLTKIIF